MRRKSRRAGKNTTKRVLGKSFAERLEPRWVLNTAPVIDPINVSPDGEEGTAITFTVTADDAETPNGLTFLLDPDETPAGASINPTTGVFTWTPSEDQGGQSFRIVVLVTDQGTSGANPTDPLSDAFELNFNISETAGGPTLDAIGDKTVNEQEAMSIVVSATDPDTDLADLTFSATGLPAGATFDAATRTFSWTPAESQGPGTFDVTFTVTDDSNPALSDSETITITVNEVNRSPDLATIADVTVALGDSVTFTATATDPDLPANGLTFSLDNSAPAGATIDPTTGAFSWTPTNGQVGVFSIIVIVTDNGSPALADSETFTVTVTSPNQPPVLTPIGDKSGDENTLITFTAAATDPEGDTLTFSLTGAPTGAAIDPVTGVFTWTPGEDQNGEFTFDVVVTDDGNPSTSDSETITITVNEVNAAPVITLVSDQTVAEGALLTVDVNATDSDLPAQTLTYSLTAAPVGAAIDAATGVITWTPGADDQGTHVFTVTVSDGTDTASQNFNVVVTDENTPPELAAIADQTADEGATVTFTATATDPDGDALTFSLDGDVPTFASITAAGVFNWATAEIDGPGTYTFDVVVTDDGNPAGTARQTITITINEVNQAPVLSDIVDQTAAEGAAFTVTAVGADADLPEQDLHFSLVGASPAGATIDQHTGVINWTPDESTGGTTVTFTVELTDGTATATTSFDVVVSEANAAPAITPIADQTIPELALFTLNVVANDGDGSSQVLTYSLDAASVAAGMTINASGQISWTPTEEQGPGTFDVTVTVTDDGTPNQSSTATFQITVTEANQAPTLSIPNQTGTEGTTLSLTVTGADADLPAQTLTYSLEPGSPAGATIDANTGAFSWLLPDVTSNSQFTVTVRVTDSVGDSTTSSFTVDVAVASPVALVKDINPSSNSNPRTLTVLGGVMYFIASDGATGFELWKTDGTEGGTTLVKDIVTGIGSSDAANLTVVDGTLYFSANDGVNGFELWKSDGTEAGTVLVKNINPGDSSSNPSNFANVNGTLYFAAFTGSDNELWKSDGTEAGTVLVKNINTNGDSTPARLTNVGGTLFFSATNGMGGVELWKSDGSEAGTVLVKEINASGDANPTSLVNVGGTLYFSANDGTGDGLWKSDGTEAGTQLISPHFTAEARYLTNVGGTLFFSATDAPNGRELWKSDGTLGGTVLVQDVFPGASNSSHPHGLTNVNGVLFFTAEGATGEGLWRSTGTGAELVKLLPLLGNLTNVNGTLFFTSDNGSGQALWMSDGTAAGTVPVGGIADGFWSDTPGNFTVMDGTLYLTSNGDGHGRELWRLVNAPPTFATPQESATLDEGELLEFKFEATDFDAGQTLTYTLDAGSAVGVVFDSATGELSWTPGEADGGQTFVLTVTATDNHGFFSLSAKKQLTITVNELNGAPTLEVTDHTLAVDANTAFTVTAADSDLPAQTLTLSVTDLPTGATFDTATGAFSWTPASNQVGTHSVTFHVTDGVVTTDKTVVLTVIASLVQEAEDAEAGGDGVTQTRGAASGGETLQLVNVGDQSQYVIDVVSAANYQLVARFSNLGGGDTVNVLINGTQVGTFATGDTADWNSFANTMPLSLGVLPAGQLTLALELATTDGGVEIDYLSLVPGDITDPGVVPGDGDSGGDDSGGDDSGGGDNGGGNDPTDFRFTNPPVSQQVAAPLAPPAKLATQAANTVIAVPRPSLEAFKSHQRVSRSAKVTDAALSELWGEM